jgi:superfamily II DNA/RNA helicase
LLDGSGGDAEDDEAEVTPKAKSAAKGPPRVSIGSVVGGLSALKQKRIVDRGADILVATPGRLWDLIKSVSLLKRVHLVVCASASADV